VYLLINVVKHERLWSKTSQNVCTLLFKTTDDELQFYIAPTGHGRTASYTMQQ